MVVPMADDDAKTQTVPEKSSSGSEALCKSKTTSIWSRLCCKKPQFILFNLS